MTELAINRRKSQLFLNNLSPVTNTYDELVSDKLKGGKFPGTKTGIIKIIGMLVILFAVTFFVTQPACDNTPDWYPYLFPVDCGLTILVQLVLFIIFTMGHTVKKPGFWIYLDIIVIFILSLTTFVCSVMTFMTCQGSGMNKIAQSCGIAGGVILVISCGAIFLMFRYVEYEEEISPRPPTTPQLRVDPRKSIHA